MRVSKWMAASLLVMGMLMATMLSAESKKPADYPLRLHIFGIHQTTHYHRGELDEATGDGRADLYENAEAHGVDFNYDCGQRLRASFGYETYPARWKKPGRELVVLFPVFGQSGKFFTCDVNTDVKDFAYAGSSGVMSSETVAQYKEWMVQQKYDPEHGKDVPMGSGTGAAAPAPTAGAPSQPQ